MVRIPQVPVAAERLSLGLDSGSPHPVRFKFKASLVFAITAIEVKERNGRKINKKRFFHGQLRKQSLGRQSSG